jgi:hypothetical protein|tara:strand:+ start:12883 stop:13239 length:357 start_codon:yes stop_codon:yes gene_type:complete
LTRKIILKGGFQQPQHTPLNLRQLTQLRSYPCNFTILNTNREILDLIESTDIRSCVSIHGIRDNYRFPMSLCTIGLSNDSGIKILTRIAYRKSALYKISHPLLPSRPLSYRRRRARYQ